MRDRAAVPPEPAITGVCPVLETPFTDDGAVDEAGFLAIIDHLLSCGVRSLMFPGFASEFHKLSDAERTRLTELLLRRTRGSGVRERQLRPPRLRGANASSVRHSCSGQTGI
jgi:hypothetical protein